MQITFYQWWRSSASWRVRWALAVKRVPHESVMIDLGAGEQRSAAHLARNPMGHVPALGVDGRLLAESVAIVEWLDEVFPEPRLFPTDPWHRARVRQVIEAVNAGIQPIQNLHVLQHRSADPEAQRAWASHFIRRGMVAVERLITELQAEFGGPFAAGPALTAADLFVVPQAYNARRFNVDLTDLPNLLAAEAAARNTPFAESVRPEALAR